MNDLASPYKILVEVMTLYFDRNILQRIYGWAWDQVTIVHFWNRNIVGIAKIFTNIILETNCIVGNIAPTVSKKVRVDV